jgi:hypothetical protein
MAKWCQAAHRKLPRLDHPSVASVPAPSSSLSHASSEITNTVTVTSTSTGAGNPTAAVTTTMTTHVTTATSNGTNSGTNPDEGAPVKKRNPGVPKPTHIKFYPNEVRPFLECVREQYKFQLYQHGFFPIWDEKMTYCQQSWTNVISIWCAGQPLQEGKSFPPFLILTNIYQPLSNLPHIFSLW